MGIAVYSKGCKVYAKSFSSKIAALSEIKKVRLIRWTPRKKASSAATDKGNKQTNLTVLYRSEKE